MRLLSRSGRVAALGALAALAFVGCEAIFTFSPVGFLQTPVGNMSPDQLSSFGDDALTSGDPVAMQEALDAIVVALADPNLTPEQLAELSLAGGSLAIELSGVGDLLDLVLSGELGLGDFSDVEAAFDSLEIDLDLLSDGADLLVAADGGGEELNSSQLALGAIGLIVNPTNDDFESGACPTDPIPADELPFHVALWSSIGLETNPDGTPTTCPPPP